MAEKFDIVVLGMGPGGEVLAGRLLAAGKKVAVVERELVGGECAYWACIPSKTLIRPPEARNEATRTYGTGTPSLDLTEVFDYRDYIIRNLDDSGQVKKYEERGARVIKGEGRLAGVGRVEVNGETLETDHVVVTVAGRTPRVEGIGLESIGVEADKSGLQVDDRCRVLGAPEGTWAVGDVTGVALFTHVAQYQGKVVAANILGGDRRTDYRGIPRVVFSDPEIAATGLTEEAAREQGLDVAAIELELPKALARSVTYEKEPRGNLGLVVDRGERVIVGAWAVAPLAGEWIHEACLAIRMRIPVDALLDTVFQFPSFSQACLEALERIEL